MNRWRLLFAVATLAALCACAAQPGPAPATLPATTPVVARTPAIQPANLPCATVDKTDVVTISYPAEAIYRSGAVLPKEEGLACLEVLSGWLKGLPQSRWQVTLSGEDGHGFEPLALAGKRQELLERFFLRKDIEVKAWEWQTAAGQAEQLQLRELKDAP